MGTKTVQERAERERSYARAGRRRSLINSLSGGVDSTASALISKRAETEDLHSLGLNVPISRDPAREADLIDARIVADTLGIPLVVVEMTDVWERIAQTLTQAAEEMTAKSGVTPGPGRLKWAANNLKPTIRMMVSGFFADAFDGLMVGTDNVIENFLGYFSVRGDGVADRQPIRDALKSEVRELVASGGLPSDLVNRTPTPGLFDFEGHTDEGELGFTYADADRFVDWILTEEARVWQQGDRFRYMDETMTLRPDWAERVSGASCPIAGEVAAKIAAQNQRTYFKRRVTDLAWTLQERGLV